jgi:TetR/AcrR family transcriptional regulator
MFVIVTQTAGALAWYMSKQQLNSFLTILLNNVFKNSLRMAVKDKGTEQLIRDTAKNIFFAQGRLHATTQDIADAAGVNRSLVHYYFRSRNLLFDQVLQEANTELKNVLDAVFTGRLHFKEKLKRLISVFIDEMLAYPFRELFIITEINTRSEHETEQIHETHIKPFLKEIAAEMEKGNLHKCNPQQFLMSLFALMAYPVLAGPLNKSFLKLTDAEFVRMMKQRKQLIFDMLYIGS